MLVDLLMIREAPASLTSGHYSNTLCYSVMRDASIGLAGLEPRVRMKLFCHLSTRLFVYPLPSTFCLAGWSALSRPYGSCFCSKLPLIAGFMNRTRPPRQDPSPRTRPPRTVLPGAILEKRLKRLEKTWSKRIGSTDVLAIIAHLQFTLNAGPVSLRAVYRQVEQMLCQRFPEAFDAYEVEGRISGVLDKLVKQGYLGYSLIEPTGSTGTADHSPRVRD